MYLFEVTLNEAKATVSFRTAEYNSRVKPFFQGDPQVIERLKNWLARSTGPFGHSFGTNEYLFVSDFDFALFSEEVNEDLRWAGSARLLEGERGDWYHLDLPEGAHP